MNSRLMNKHLLGYQLVKDGIITDRQLEEALGQYKPGSGNEKKQLLGQTLVKLGYCTEDDIAMSIAKKTGAMFFSLRDTSINMSAANLISVDIVSRYNVLPIGFEDNRLLVAMMNPLDIIAIDDLRLLTGYEIQPAVLPDTELKYAIEQFVNSNSGIVDTISEKDESEESTENEDIDQRPIVQLANQIFNLSVKAGASDVHIEPQEKRTRVRLRIDGVLHEVMKIPTNFHTSLISRIKVMSNMDISKRRVPQDGRITMKIEGKTIDVRVASLPSAFGEKITMRLLNRSDRLITLGELGFPEEQLTKYHETIDLPYGFFLITGPTGSGKSTTLYATLARLNKVEKNIITLEDPIERRMEGLNQVQINSTYGVSFASGLRSILRNDPDTIMVGEIRDFETAKISVESALTGHLVLSTLHTNDSAGAITRLGDMGIEPYLTASSLIGVIAQRLARVLCSKCKISYGLPKEKLLKILPDFPVDTGTDTYTLYKPKGCIHCNNTGYRGRIGVFEALFVTEEIKKLILDRSSAQAIKEAAVSGGMVTLRHDGLLKVKKGITSLEELMRVII